MKWSVAEIERLNPVLEEVRAGLEPMCGREILVLCSAGGEMAFWLAEGMKAGQLLGVELNEGLLESARTIAEEKQLSGVVEFRGTEKARLSLADETFDRLVSEFIVFPTPTPTEMGQAEMARVLKPGGRMVITDVIAPNPVPPELREELRKIGLDYLCEGTVEDFRGWMEGAGLVDIEVKDLTPLVKTLWEERQKTDEDPEHRRGYALLLEDSPVKLGEGLFYICARGTKPDG